MCEQEILWGVGMFHGRIDHGHGEMFMLMS